MTRSTDWFVPLVADGGLRLFGLPHAGAGCAQMSGFARAMARHGVSVWSANLPGRQARLDEPPFTEFGPLVEELTNALLDRLDERPYALFGYCGGALLAYGIAQQLLARLAPLPQRLVAVSYEAPDIARRPRGVPALPSEQLWSYLHNTGGVPASLGGDARVRRIAESAIRADFAVLGGYQHRPTPPLPVPVTVVYGSHDHELERGALLGWRRHTVHPVDLRPVGGGHWLLDDAGPSLAAAVAEALSGGDE